MSKAIGYSNNEQKFFSRENNKEIKSQIKLEKKEEGKKENIKATEIKDKDFEKNELNKDLEETNIDEVLFNNNNSNGSLMITELINVKNNNNIKKEDNEKQLYLKKKYQELKTPLNLQKGIYLGMESSLKYIHEQLINENLKINGKNLSFTDIVKKYKKIPKTLIKNRSALNLTGINEKNIFKKNLKLLNNFMKDEDYLKKNIIKLEQNYKFYENMSFPKENLVEKNINDSKLKSIENNKEILMKKLSKLNEQIKKINNFLKDDKKSRKDKLKTDFSILEDYQEQYNKQLLLMEKKEKSMRLKYKKNIKLSFEKRKKELDEKEKQIIAEKKKNLQDLKKKEKQLSLKRKQKMDKIVEKYKKYMKEKTNKTENDYIYYKYQEKFEKNENKLYEKYKKMKKDPLVTKEEIKELLSKIKEQKKILLMDNVDKMKNLLKLWSYRSISLPTYRSPLLDIIEKEKNSLKESLEQEKKRKESNELKKQNYKPPKSYISLKLKKQREKRVLNLNMEKIREIELNNKKKLNSKYSKYKSVSPIPKKKNSTELFKEISSNNYIDINELNSLKHKKKTKIIKPINILRLKKDKSTDYLREMAKKKQSLKRNNSNSLFSIRKFNEKDLTSLESLMAMKDEIDLMNDKIKTKKKLLKVSCGYYNNPGLVNDIGKLLINSAKIKLSFLSKIYD